MTVAVRMTHGLFAQLQTDMSRPHRFAAERVAFAFGRVSITARGIALVVTSFIPVDDPDYEEDDYVGARIGAMAIHKALQHALSAKAAAFHIHRHDHDGMPWFSRTDLRELPAVMKPFGQVVRDQPHGLLLLSFDDCTGLVWDRARDRPRVIGEAIIVGTPMRILRGQRS